MALKLALSLGLAAALSAESAQASLLWRWTCRGHGFHAAGGFTTTDQPNADGFYEITSIEGHANGVAIVGLQKAGTSIPGNEGYPVDSLVRLKRPQLTKDGFGFALANKTYANPFYGAHFAKPGYYAFIVDPANNGTREPAVTFTAVVVRERGK